MRFPVGLLARLAQRKSLQLVNGSSASAIFHLSPLVNHFPPGARVTPISTETEWHPLNACVRAAEQAHAPVVWIGGTEPLFHPAIGDITSALADSGRYVFLHTSGVGLRKRIHEFTPIDRLYLCLEIPLDNASALTKADARSATLPFHALTEALRVARLSGFRVCAHFTIAATASAAIAARMNALQAQHLDGVVVSSGGVFSENANAETQDRAFAEVARLIPASGWRYFSRILELSYRQNALEREAYNPQTHAAAAPEEAPCEESA